jgi:2-polyprenyl-3-methyl-5-hydroxy-6-metoxy-1,4-benzoquinol methylase
MHRKSDIAVDVSTQRRVNRKDAMSGYFDTLRDEIEPLVPDNPTMVMDVGCGAGITSRWLKQIRPNITTIGVEIDASVASIAASVVDSVLVADLNQGIGALADYEGRIELLLLLDVLEHLLDPWTRLTELKRLLAPTGVVIASIPNVRNLKVLAPLLFKGDWRYQSSGILDRTHVRFFTRRTVLELLSGAGYEIQRLAFTGPLRPSRIKSLSGGGAYLANKALGGALNDFVAHQYVVRAVPAAGSRIF